jgi:hypothetical protein
MRCTQFQGLTEEAEAFLSESGKHDPATTCPHCGETLTWQLRKTSYASGKHLGMFDDGPEFLYDYTLKDDTTVREVVQETVWSSGPVIFLALQKPDGQIIYPWPQEAIDNA